MHRRLQESSTCPQHWRLKPNSQKKRLLALCEKLRGVHQNPRWKYASNANLGLALMGPCVSLSGSIHFSLVKAQRYSCYGRRNKQVCSQCCKPRACRCIYRQLCKIKRWIQFGWNTSNIRTCPNPCLPKTCTLEVLRLLNWGDPGAVTFLHKAYINMKTQLWKPCLQCDLHVGWVGACHIGAHPPTAW